MTNNKISTKSLVFCGLMTALLCVAGPLSIPLPGLVPVSLTNLALYLIVYLIGWKRAALCNLLYLLIGAIGLPVFSGFTGGLPKLAGPTGGYLLGFVFMTILCGLSVEKFPSNRLIQCFGMAAGTLVCYAFGTIWLARVAHLTVLQALAAGVLPFVPGDLVKIALAVVIGPMLRDRLSRVNLLPAAR